MWLDEYGLRRPYKLWFVCLSLSALGVVVLMLADSLEWRTLGFIGVLIAVPSILFGIALTLFIGVEQGLQMLGYRSVSSRLRSLTSALRARRHR